MQSLEDPSYIHDEREVIKLLSRLGVTSQKDIELFQMLCTKQQATLSYEEILLVTDLSLYDYAFIGFLKRLEEKQIAILRHTIAQNTLKPFYLRLCDEGSYEFLYEYISEAIVKGYVDPQAPLPTYSELRKKNMHVPRKHTASFEYISLETSFSEIEPTIPSTNVSIYTIPIIKDIFFCTDVTINLLINICMIRIQLILNNPNGVLVHEISKILNQKLSEIKEKITTLDYHTWNEIISKLYEQLESLHQNNKVKIYPEFIDLVLILHGCIKPQIIHMEATRDKKNQITGFLTDIVDIVRTQGKEIESKIAMQEFIDDTAQRYKLTEETKEEALATLNNEIIVDIKDIETQKSASIVKIDTYYIHNDNVAPIISDHYFPLCEKLNEYYTVLLYKYLTKKLSPKELVFFNEENFEVSVRQQVLEHDKLFHKILKNPIFLASSIIQLSKKNNAFENTTNIIHKEFKLLSVSKQLSAFFDLRTQLLLTWREIFGINLLKLTQDAYSKLGIFRKMVLIFTGRYKSMLNKLKKINEKLSSVHKISSDTPSNKKIEVHTTNH